MSGENDLLERATRALRATPPPSDDELLAARQRLLAAQRGATKSSRARTLRWVLPLAAMLAAGSALAATPGAYERVAEAVTALLQHTPLAAHKSHPKEKAPRARPALARHDAPPPTPVTTPALVDDGSSAERDQLAPQQLAAGEDEAERERLREERRRRREPRARSERAAAGSTPRQVSGAETSASADSTPPLEQPEAAAVAPEPAHDKDLALYRQAHEKHFRARDFAAALRGWNLYLQAFPSGTFAVEARYNRAICLVRLDQKDEARRALMPFAKGEVARGYRQAEATKLLKALE